MARKKTRGKRQVVGDKMIQNRERRFSIDVPISEAHQTWPLASTAKEPSIFDQVQITYHPQENITYKKKGSQIPGAPHLVFDHVIHGVDTKGIPFSRKGTGFWTSTAKMGAPSFSVPSGPTYEGGTCVAANKAAEGGGKRTPGEIYICDRCYALAGNYVSPNNTFCHEAHASWVRQSLEADPTGALLASSLTAALVDFARLPCYGLPLQERMGLEFGVWKDRRIQVPWYNPVLDCTDWANAIVVPLPPGKPSFGDSLDFFRAQKPRSGQIVGFFRIHDGGDLSVGPSQKHWKAYLNAWATVAKAFPHVLFWLPTRVWIFPTMLKALRQAASEAPNLIIRPSGLNAFMSPPEINGLSGSTGAVERVAPWTFGELPLLSGGVAYTCPVGTRFSYSDKYKKRIHPKSCQMAHCRACWVFPDLPIAYGFKR